MVDLERLLDSGEYARAALLASQLPAESRTVRHYEPRAAWGQEAYLLALIADNLSFQRYELAGGKGQKPAPVPRPAAAPAKGPADGMSDEQVERLLLGPRR